MRANNRVRLTWQPVDWSHDSTVQVTVSASSGGTVVRFHQERLASAAERERQRAH
ncbi:SRPBCC domain-containing protein [Kribbella sp. NPDC004138]